MSWTPRVITGDNQDEVRPFSGANTAKPIRVVRDASTQNWRQAVLDIGNIRRAQRDAAGNPLGLVEGSIDSFDAIYAQKVRAINGLTVSDVDSLRAFGVLEQDMRALENIYFLSAIEQGIIEHSKDFIDPKAVDIEAIIQAALQDTNQHVKALKTIHGTLAADYELDDVLHDTPRAQMGFTIEEIRPDEIKRLAERVREVCPEKAGQHHSR